MREQNEKHEPTLDEIIAWARRKMREEAKEREMREYESGSDSKPRLVLGRKPAK